MSVTLSKKQFESLVETVRQLQQRVDNDLETVIARVEALEKKTDEMLEHTLGIAEVVESIQIKVKNIKTSTVRNTAAIREVAGNVLPLDQVRTSNNISLDGQKGFWKSMNHPKLTNAVNKYMVGKDLDDDEIVVLLQYLKLFLDDRTEDVLENVDESKEGIDLLLSELINYHDPLSV
jgi:hypothetical protein